MTCLLFFATGWRSVAPDGHCVVHLDKSFYVNGEVIWYKLYLPAGYRQTSLAVKVAVLNAEGRTVHYHFKKNRGASFVHGYYKIPFDQPSGLYRLAFSGRHLDSRAQVPLATATVPVYNDHPRAVPAAAASATVPAAAPALDELEVSIELSSQQLVPRGPMRAIIEVRDGDGRPVAANLSVAVTDWALSEGAASRALPVYAGQPSVPSYTGQLDSAVTTAVRILNEAGEPLPANVLGVYLGNENRLLFAKSNGDGLSYLALPDFFGSKSIQYLGYEKETSDIDLVRLDDIHDPVPALPSANEGVLHYLELSRLRKKIYQHRQQLEFAVKTETTTPTSAYPEADLVLDVQDYESFEDIATFFREVDSPLRFQLQRDSTYRARLFNPRARSSNSFELGTPLFVIDGKVTRNVDFVARLSTDQVQRVHLFFNRERLRQHFPVFGNRGVVLIETTIPDVPLPPEDARDIIRINGLQPPAAFPVFHPDQIDNDPHRAFFRPQLYWNPDLRTDERGRAILTFHQSDDRSIFRIAVVAQSAAGVLGAGSKEYRVR